MRARTACGSRGRLAEPHPSARLAHGPAANDVAAALQAALARAVDAEAAVAKGGGRGLKAKGAIGAELAAYQRHLGWCWQ